MAPLEQAARALWELCGKPTKAPGADTGGDLAAGEPDWKRFVPHARAVLEAVREPDDEMKQAGAEIVRNVHAEESTEAFASDAANTWRFMIDVVLSTSRVHHGDTRNS